MALKLEGGRTAPKASSGVGSGLGGLFGKTAGKPAATGAAVGSGLGPITKKAVNPGSSVGSGLGVKKPIASKPAAKPPAAKPAASRSVPTNGATFATSPVGGGGGGGGGANMDMGGGGAASDFTAAPVPAMQTLTIPDAMAEQSYQEQIAQLARNMTDFKAQQDLADNQYTGSFNQATRKLGVNGDKFDRNLQGGQYGQSVAANENDFAARGGLRSGLFVKSQSDLDSDFNSRLGEMNRARGDFRDTAALSRQNLESQNEIARQQALQSAVAAVAARYGVNSDQVGRGSSNTIQRAV